jgi:hypothetical protein
MNTLPDPNRDGEYRHFLPNGSGKCGSIGIQMGLTPKVRLVSAGYGIQLVAADGATVILDVSESGTVAPAGGYGIPTLLADPTTGDPKLYMLAGVLRFWDGSAAHDVILGD